MRAAEIVVELSMEATIIRQPAFPRRAAQGDVMLTIPMSDAIHKTLQGAARARGISLTLWARAVLLRAAAETPRGSQSLAS
jgi:predicted HicB family RNase H-like nuclease